MRHTAKLFSIVIVYLLILYACFINPPVCLAAHGTSLVLPVWSVESSPVNDREIATVIPDGKALTEALKGNPAVKLVTVPVTVDSGTVKVRLDNEVLKTLDEKNLSIDIQTPMGSYLLPFADIDTDNLAELLKADERDLSVSVVISKTNNEKTAQVKKLVQSNGYSQAAVPTEFRIEAAGGANTLEINEFDTYITRTIPLDEDVDPKEAVAAVLGSDNTLHPVPTRFTETDGKTTAVINHKSNGIYTVLVNRKRFPDTEGHWAGEEINTMASKLVVSGRDNGLFIPEGEITRAEFASIIVRALGLEPQACQKRFRDVADGDWFSGAVGAAVKACIITGYNDGTFRPDQPVTREQAVSMVIRALQTVEGSSALLSGDGAGCLDEFRDKESVSPWAAGFLAVAVKNSIITGDLNSLILPEKVSSRAEAVVMVRKMMIRSGFITPAFTLKLPADGFCTNEKTVAISGSVQPGSSVVIDGIPVLSDGSGAFKKTVELHDGSNKLTVIVTDPWGCATIITRDLTVEPNPTGIILISPSEDTITNKGPYTVKGTAAPGITARVNGAPVSVDSGGRFSRVVKLNLGKNLLTVTGEDCEGNKFTLNRTITYDNIPPPLAVTSPTEGAETGNSMMIVTGYTEQQCSVKVNDMAVSTDNSGNFSKVVDLAVFSNNLTVVSSDAAGNTTTVQRTVTFNDNRITGLKLPEVIKLGSNVSVRYNLTLDGYVTVKIFNPSGGCVRTIIQDERRTARAYAQTWDGTDDRGTLVPDGTYRFVVEARDERGNIIGRAEKSQIAARKPALETESAKTEVFNPLLGQTCAINYSISTDALVNVTVSKGSTPVKVLTANEYKQAGTYTIHWDGTDEEGKIVPDGLFDYKIEITSPMVPALKSMSKGSATVEKEAPSITDLKCSPKPFRIKSSNLRINYRLSEKSRVTLKILDKAGKVVFTGPVAEEQNAGANGFLWDGKSNTGQYIIPGKYTVRMCAADGCGKLSQVSTLDFEAINVKPGKKKGLYLGYTCSVNNSGPEWLYFLDGSAPVLVTEFTVTPVKFKIGASNLNVRYTLTSAAKVNVEIRDSNRQPVCTLVANSPQQAGLHRASWYGSDNSGKSVDEGIYYAFITATDESTNASTEIEQAFTAGYLPEINSFTVSPEIFNPNDTAAGKVQIRYAISTEAVVTLKILDSRNRTVCSLLDGVRQKAGENILTWDGRDSGGKTVADGLYVCQLTAVSQAVSTFKTVSACTVGVEKERPQITNLTISPKPFRYLVSGQMTIRYTLSENSTVTVAIRKDGVVVRSILNEEVSAGVKSAWWDGRDDSGNCVAQGEYTVEVTAVDVSGKSEKVQEDIIFYPCQGVISTEPEAEAKDCPVDSTILVAFSDKVQKGANFQDVALTVEGKKVACTVIPRGSQLTIKPSARMAYATGYTVNVPAGAVQDSLGNPLKDPFTFSFTTEGIPREAPATGVVTLSDAATSSVAELGDTTTAEVAIDEKTALEIIEKTKNVKRAVIPVTLSADKAQVRLTAGLVKKLASANTLIDVRLPNASLTLPAAAIPLEELSGRLGVGIFGLSIDLNVAASGAAETVAFTKLARGQKLTVVSGPVSFGIAGSANGRTVAIRDLGRFAGYVVYLPKGVDTNQVAGVQMTDSNGIIPMPTGSTLTDGRAGIVIHSRATGTFAVVRGSRAFGDIKTHWARQDISLMSARLIVAGEKNNYYSPDRSVTRAQFVTMIVKALGLQPKTPSMRFPDVGLNAWYNGYIGAAVENGFITGFADRTFRPDAPVSREQAAVIVMRAMKWAGLRDDLAAAEPEKALAVFRDRYSISTWAEADVAGAVSNSLILGYKNGTFAPGRKITRAESTVIVRKLLTGSGLM